MDKYKHVQDLLKKFNQDRDWDQFHDSKNLSLALFLEAAELNELFLWKNDKEAELVDIKKLKEELADVLCYAIMLSDKHHLDIFDIVIEKIKLNEKKYPADKARGSAKKYNEL